MNESIAADLHRLDMVVMEHLDDGLGIIGNVPEWLSNSIPMSPQRRTNYIVPFSRKLSARRRLIENDPGSELKSGLWSEIDRSSNECHLEALAVCLKTRKYY